MTLDPHACFPTNYISRSTIAQDLTLQHVDAEGNDLEPVLVDDPRLTDDFCKLFALEYGDWLCDVEGLDVDGETYLESEAEFYAEWLKKLFTS